MRLHNIYGGSVRSDKNRPRRPYSSTLSVRRQWGQKSDRKGQTHGEWEMSFHYRLIHIGCPTQRFRFSNLCIALRCASGIVSVAARLLVAGSVRLNVFFLSMRGICYKRHSDGTKLIFHGGLIPQVA